MTEKMSEAKKIIELRNVTVEFDGEKILDNMSLYIREKEFISSTRDTLGMTASDCMDTVAV